MKIIAFVRFVVVAYIVYKLTDATVSFLATWDTTELAINIVMDILTGIFVFYNIRQGLFELGSKLGRNASRPLRIYALGFEVIMILGIVWVAITWEAIVNINVVLAIVVLIAFIALALVDLRNLRAAK